MSDTNTADSVRSTLSSLRADYGARFPRAGLIREDWNGTRIATNRYFCALQGVVTNQWRDVLSCLPGVTNQDDRLIVIAAGAANSESDYLARIDTMADMVLSNKVSTFELIYFRNRCSAANHYAESVFLRRYNENAISNLIMKVKVAGGLPEDVSEIFSGEGKRWYETAVREGLIP